MDIGSVLEFATSQGIWCALFIWLFYSSRQDSKAREQQLMSCLNSQTEQMKDIAVTLDRVIDILST